MPPMPSPLPVAFRLPETLRFFTAPSFSTARNSPCVEPAPSKRRPIMLCPCPSKVPFISGTGSKSSPVRFMSASSTIVFPLDHSSETQFSASAESSFAVEMLITSPLPAARAAGSCAQRSAATENTTRNMTTSK